MITRSLTKIHVSLLISSKELFAKSHLSQILDCDINVEFIQNVLFWIFFSFVAEKIELSFDLFLIFKNDFLPMILFLKHFLHNYNLVTDLLGYFVFFFTKCNICIFTYISSCKKL